MKYTKRILSFALVLVMVFALCAPALADAQKKYEPYKVYTCLGDSVAAGELKHGTIALIYEGQPAMAPQIMLCRLCAHRSRTHIILCLQMRLAPSCVSLAGADSAAMRYAI